MTTKAERESTSGAGAPVSAPEAEPDAYRVLQQLRADEQAARERLAQLEAEHQRLADGVIRGIVTHDELAAVTKAIADVNGQLTAFPLLRERARALWQTQQERDRREAYRTAVAVTRDAYGQATALAEEIDQALAAIAPTVARLRSLLDWSELRGVMSDRSVDMLRVHTKESLLDDRIEERLRALGIKTGFRVESEQLLASWIARWTSKVIEIAERQGEGEEE